MEKWEIDAWKSIPGYDDFVVNQSDVANEKKKKLIEMAKNGEDRPTVRGHKLGFVLVEYTKNNGCYDPIFDKKIRKLRPDWFEKSSSIKKEGNFKIARSGKNKTFHKSKLWIYLKRYVNKNSDTYDNEFTKKIKELRPEWLIETHAFNSSKKKKKLIDMAKNGECRPIERKHKLGRVLSYYTNKKRDTYDPAFDKEIRKLAPHWFRG